MLQSSVAMLINNVYCIDNFLLSKPVHCILVVTDYGVNLCRSTGVRCRLFSLAVVSFTVPFCKRKSYFLQRTNMFLNIQYITTHIKMLDTCDLFV